MIGLNTMVSTVGHLLSPMGRRKHLGIAKPVKIGNDVWIAGNVTILPGVMIGNNVIIAAVAVENLRFSAWGERIRSYSDWKQNLYKPI